MDAADEAIVRALGIEPFSAGARPLRPWRPEALAQAAKVPARLAKDRLAQLERKGVVAGYEVQPNLRCMGLGSRTFAFQVPVRQDRRERLAAVRELDGVLGYVEYLTGWLTVTIAHEDDQGQAARLEALQAALGTAPPVTWFAVDYPPCTHAMTRLDWRLVAALRGNARRSLSDLAADVGVSAKTVQRRLDLLAAAGALDMYAKLGDRAFDELLICSLSVRVQPASARAAIGALHAGPLADAWSRCSGPFVDGVHHDLVVTARTPRGMAQMLEDISRIPGVVDVQGHLASRAEFVHPWLDAILARRRDETLGPDQG